MISRPAPERLPLDATLEQAAALLAEADTPLLPVVGADEELLGVITRRNVLDAIAARFPFPEHERHDRDLACNRRRRPHLGTHQ